MTAFVPAGFIVVPASGMVFLFLVAISVLVLLATATFSDRLRRHRFDCAARKARLELENAEYVAVHRRMYGE